MVVPFGNSALAKEDVLLKSFEILELEQAASYAVGSNSVPTTV